MELDGQRILFLSFLVFDADTSADIQLSFTITYKGINHTRTVVIRTVKDGDKGDKGEQGAVLRGPQAWADCSVGYVSKQAEKMRAGKMLYFITITITAVSKAMQKQRQTIREVRLM